MHASINEHVHDCGCTCSVYCFHQIYITTLGNGNRKRYVVEGGSTTEYFLSNISSGQYALHMSAMNMYGEGSATTPALEFAIC